jgi:NADH:ubiquinone oxidoreductase subunit E
MNTTIREILHQFNKDRSSLVPILLKIQETEHYLSHQAVTEVSLFLGISENDVYSVASFYPRLNLTQSAKHTIKVCQCTACHLKIGEGIMDVLIRELNIQPGQTTPDFRFSLEKTAYPGCPDLAPIIVIDNEIHYRMTPAKVKIILEKYRHGDCQGSI